MGNADCIHAGSLKHSTSERWVAQHTGLAPQNNMSTTKDLPSIRLPWYQGCPMPSQAQLTELLAAAHALADAGAEQWFPETRRRLRAALSPFTDTILGDRVESGTGKFSNSSIDPLTELVLNRARVHTAGPECSGPWHVPLMVDGILVVLNDDLMLRVAKPHLWTSDIRIRIEAIMVGAGWTRCIYNRSACGMTNVAWKPPVAK